VGRLVSEDHHGENAAYAYDAIGQLLSSNSSSFGVNAYSYDAGGNRNSAGYVIGAGNRISADSVFDYGYDAEGNVITKTERSTGTATTFTYDHRNRLVDVEVRDAGASLLNTVQYTYDALDRRIISSVDGQVTATVYDGNNVWSDFDALANPETRYMFGESMDELFARSNAAGVTDWFLTDRLGTLRDISNGTSGVVAHVDYDPYGIVLAETDPSQSGRFMFTGREHEGVSGLYNYRARYYDPALGRFVSEDPMGFDAGDLNLYRYLNNSPLNGTDPTGQQSLIEFADFLCTVASAASFGNSVGQEVKKQFTAINSALEGGTPSYDPSGVGDIVWGVIPPCGLPIPPPSL